MPQCGHAHCTRRLLHVRGQRRLYRTGYDCRNGSGKRKPGCRHCGLRLLDGISVPVRAAKDAAETMLEHKAGTGTAAGEQKDRKFCLGKRTARLCSKALYFRSAVSKIFIRSTGYSQEHSVSRCFRSECIIMCSGKKASQIQKAFLPRMHSCCGRCTKLLHTSRKRSRSFIRKEYTYRTEIILLLRS